MYDKSFYRKVYDLLADNGQIRRSDWYVAEKDRFAEYFTDDCGRQWRFQGDLGFGGKFWHNNGRHYVSYYPEDRTAKREKLANRLNTAIAELEAQRLTERSDR